MLVLHRLFYCACYWGCTRLSLRLGVEAFVVVRLPYRDDALLFVPRALAQHGTPLVPVVLKAQGDETQADPDEDDEEHAANVLDADAIAFVLDFGAVQTIELPPGGL